MKNAMVGDRVKLMVSTKNTLPEDSPTLNSVAIVRHLLSDTPGGLFLDSPLGGLQYWNEADLVKVGHRNALRYRRNKKKL